MPHPTRAFAANKKARVCRRGPERKDAIINALMACQNGMPDGFVLSIKENGIRPLPSANEYPPFLGSFLQ
jgi:hypothetical protein